MVKGVQATSVGARDSLHHLDAALGDLRTLIDTEGPLSVELTRTLVVLGEAARSVRNLASIPSAIPTRSWLDGLRPRSERSRPPTPTRFAGHRSRPHRNARLSAVSRARSRVGTEVRYAEVERWAEPLPTLFGRALGQDLAALLGARIVPYPWYRATPLDLVVRVDVTTFEAGAAGSARLDACWRILGSRGTAVCRDDCSSIVEAVDERGAPAQVAGLIGELAQRVAMLARSASRCADAARVSRDIPAASIPPTAGTHG
jgi:hypothetical protein